MGGYVKAAQQGYQAYETGKSWLRTVKGIFKRKITPKLGAHVYKYVDHVTGVFSIKTGQFFNEDWAALGYLGSLGLKARVPSDGLVYLPKQKVFAGYSLVNGALWDRNVVSWGVPIMTDSALVALANSSGYSRTPQAGTPVPKTTETIDPLVPTTLPTSPTAKKSPIPILGLVGLGIALFKK